METIALIVHPNQEIFAVEGLLKPQRPMHSGYINEELENTRHYLRQRRDYDTRLKTAIKCDQTIAERVLLEQYPERKILAVMEHYNVTGVTLNELCGKEVVSNKINVPVITDEDDWAARETHQILSTSFVER